jgi:MFS family permease
MIVETDIPARLDRLPWSRFHWRIVIGLGTVWVLDGLEVTIVGAIAPRMTESGSGINLTTADVGTAAALYVAGACLGALVFGRLTDRFGRRKLFMLTMGLYLAATVATAFSFAPWYFFVCRALTGFGIGGEYSAINSAIDELIPARNRGRVDVAINGSFWVGAAIGGLASLFLLDQGIFAPDFGWRLAFGAGAILGLGILLVRRSVPESPRWLIIHGHLDEAERIVGQIEREVQAESGADLPEPGSRIKIRQRDVIPFREIAAVAIKHYPNRVILGLALFVGQAFLYNAVTFDLGTILSRFFDVSSGAVPYFMIIFAVSNFLGPLTLGRLFDTVGRIPMIAGTYLGSAAVVTLLAVLLRNGGLTRWSFMALILAAFFLASAGASAAYLTVSEIFPMETRSLSIALFYAVGTAVGGISGPLLFGQLIHSGSVDQVATGFFIGAGAMALGGVAELLFGVRAEGQSLEDIATPLTAEEAEAALADEAGPAAAGTAPPTPTPTPAEAAADERIARRVAARRARDRAGPRRFRPGPGSTFPSPAMIGTAGTASRYAAMAERDRDREIEAIAAVCDGEEAIDRDELRRRLHAEAWGPGRFRSALREAVQEGRAGRRGHHAYGRTRGAVSPRRGGAARSR